MWPDYLLLCLMTAVVLVAEHGKALGGALLGMTQIVQTNETTSSKRALDVKRTAARCVNRAFLLFAHV